MAETEIGAGDGVEARAQQLYPNWHEAEQVVSLTRDELDELPYGVIQLDADGKILQYNVAESEISGRDPEAVLGRDFFEEVAPCTNVQRFGGRFREGVKNRSLNEIFPYTFDFQMSPVTVWVRLYFSTATNTAWVFVTRRDEDSPTVS